MPRRKKTPEEIKQDLQNKLNEETTKEDRDTIGINYIDGFGRGESSVILECNITQLGDDDDDKNVLLLLRPKQIEAIYHYHKMTQHQNKFDENR